MENCELLTFIRHCDDSLSKNSTLESIRVTQHETFISVTKFNRSSVRYLILDVRTPYISSLLSDLESLEVQQGSVKVTRRTALGLGFYTVKKKKKFF